jgi:hypothetical protein
MLLDLNDVEVTTLLAAIEGHLHQLRTELSGTDDRDCRHQLSGLIGSLESVERRFKERTQSRGVSFA